MHTLLAQQVSNFLPEELSSHPAIEKLLAVINESYHAYEKDSELSGLAFKKNESEYLDINQKLTQEIEVRQKSVERIKNVIGTITGLEKAGDSDDLLMIARYLSQQVNKRKQAELVFTSLITNMQSAVLLEDENRLIVFTNQAFCDLFKIPAKPASLQGADCSGSAEQSKLLFKYPDLFVANINRILEEKKLVSGEVIELADGRILERDYIPIFLNTTYKGHFWSYTDITASKKAQYAIEKSELTNRLILNSALDAIIITNDKAEISFWNPRAEQIFGWQENEVRARSLSDIIYAGDARASRQTGLAYFTNIIANSLLNNITELTAVDKDRREFPIEVSMIRIIQDDQEFFCSFIRDISERKKTEEELKHLALVASSNKNGVIFTDTNGKIFWANEGFCANTGYSIDEIKGMTPVEISRGPLSDKSTIKKMIAAFEAGHSFDIEVIHYRKDGSWFWGRSEGQPIKDVEGKVTHYFAMLEDITQHKLQEEQLQILSSIAAQNTNAVVIADKSGKIEWVNCSFEKMTGYSLTEIKGKAPGRFLQGPGTSVDTDKYLKAQIAAGEPFSCEILNYTKAGMPYWVRIQGQSLKDTNGETFKYFAIEENITAEKIAAEKMREAEQLWKFALEGAGDGVWEVNFKTQTTFYSRQYKNMLGYEDHEFANNSQEWKNRIHPDDVHIIEETEKQYEEKLISAHKQEYRIKHKNGSYIWMLDRGMIIDYDADRNPVRLIGTHTNISSIKDTENALRKSEEEFRSLAENIPGILYRYEFSRDGNEKFTYISPEPEKKIGLTDAELQNFYLYIHPDDLERERVATKIALDNKAPFEFEGRFVIPGKPVIWLNISSYFSYRNEEGVMVRSGLMLNVTKEKEAEMGLQIREEKYRNIIANMNLGLLEVDRDEIIQFANQSFCEMSGFSLEEMIGKTATKLFVRGENQELIETKNDLRNKGISDAYEICIRNKKGELKWWLISGAPRLDDTGQLVGSIGIHLDITEHKQLELELIEARELSELSSNAKQTFLANMSHEIRTPMNAILGMTNQLAKTELNSNQQFYLNTIHTAADNLLIIINDILDLSKIDAGKVTLEKIGFDLREVTSRVMQVMRHKAEEKGLNFTNETPDAKLAPIFLGDPYRLNQVLLNLVTNAIKFTQKGSVTISCKLLEEKPQRQKLQIAITDTGIGMDDHFIKSLFDKFTQEDNSIIRKYGGTGLGMSISKDLVDLMGGKIVVKSLKGKGTSIAIIFEFEKGSEDDLPKKEVANSDTAILFNKKILVTDDNEMNQLVAFTMLQNYGANLSKAFNGLEALEKIRTEHFDIVLMDVQMPVMDGIEATRIIRETFSKDLPVIALTALAIKGDNEKCLEAGMDDYLSKPFGEAQLVNIVSKWLTKSSMRNNTESTFAPVTLFDLSGLQEMARGNQVFINKMLHLFKDQTPATVKEIQVAYHDQNFEQVRKLAHRIKPSIDNMGIRCLKNEIREIETQAEEYKTSARLEWLITNLHKVISEVIVTLPE